MHRLLAGGSNLKLNSHTFAVHIHLPAKAASTSGSLRSQKLRRWSHMSSKREITGHGWLFLDTFAHRQFEGGPAAQLQVSRDEFMKQLHALSKQADLVDGYAPFCKHLFVPNFAKASLNSLPITDENRHLLASGYSQRRPEELAVLTRWFPNEKVASQEAKFLDVILYSREQLVKEHSDLPEEGAAEELPSQPWGVISIKPQDEDYETPMQPITIMRNSLGRNEGGSGVPLDKAAYEASVSYWQHHAPVIAGNPCGE